MAEPQLTLYRDWKSWDVACFGVIGDQAEYFRVELAKSGVRKLQGVRVMELGFGNGGFAAWAASCGMDYVGTEIDPELVRRARDRGLCAYLADEAFDKLACKPKFEVCVAWDVLEHLERDQLVGFLRDLRLLLTAGGVLIARVPSGDSPFSAAIQNGDPTHAPPMGSGAIRYLAMQAGFTSVATRAAALPVRGSGVRAACRRLLVHCCDRACHSIVRVLMRNRHAVLTPNLVFTMRN